MAESVGAVEIVFNANLAQFKAQLADGSTVVTRETRKMSQEFRAQSNEAKGSLALLGEEIGVGIPRHLRTVIAQLPGLGSALSAAFSGIAIVAAATVISEVIDKTKELASEMGGFGKSAQEAFAKVVASNKQAADAADQLKQKYREIQLIGLTGLAKDSKQLALNALSEAELREKINQALIRQNTLQAQIAQKSAPNPLAPGTGQVASYLGNKLGITEGTDGLTKQLKESENEAQALITALHHLQEKGAELAATTTVDAREQAEASRKQTLEVLNNWLKRRQADVDEIALLKQKAEAFVTAQRKETAAEEAKYAATSRRETFEAGQDAAKRADKDLEGADRAVIKRSQEVNLAIQKNADTWKEFGSEIGQTIQQSLLFGRGWQDALKTLLFDLVKVTLQLTLMKNLTGGSSGGGIFNSLLSGVFGGAKAAGGPVSSGVSYLVGEKGPELFTPRGAGSITPNGAGGTTTIFAPHIDARGADAGVEDRVMRALRSSEDRAVSRSVMAQRDLQRRRTS